MLEEVSNGILAGWRHGISVAMTTNATFVINSFSETSKMDYTQENPDYENPPGHFLPMGVTIIELQTCDEFWVQFQLENKREVKD
jgi:hypothetical protein